MNWIGSVGISATTPSNGIRTLKMAVIERDIAGIEITKMLDYVRDNLTLINVW